ncbi:MAG: hypothetical protein GY803_28970, partial [Chloroflexi bacterium]|nr:hypothetical protein [Chloroflexota bacterium]
NAVLELQAPTDKTLQDMLHLIATYVQDGAKVEANARIQWIDLQKQADSQQSRQRLTGRVRSMLPGRSSSAQTPSIQEETSEGSETDAERDDPVGSEAGELMVLEGAGERAIPIPDNPGVLVKNHQDKMIELKLDPATFVDRTDHLEICDACAATVMRGSLYCPNCGRPLTLSAVQPELRDGVESAVTGSVRYGLIGLAFNLAPLLLIIVPALFRSPDETFLNRVGAGLSTPIVVAAFILGLGPMLFMAWRAIVQAQRASWYFNLSATPERAGKVRGMLGNALGWFTIYLAIAWALFVVVALF